MLLILSRIHTGLETLQATTNYVPLRTLKLMKQTFAKDKMIVFRGGRLEYEVLNFNNTGNLRIT